MPIINLQRRHAELGRIRLGQKVATQSGKTRPDKLDRFRFTSPNPRLIDSLSELYGGEARPWDNNGKPEHEVITEAKSIPVVVLKGGMSQWWETWSGGGCVHRCDGEKDPTGVYCDPADPKHQQAKATTRLSVILLELGAIGVFRLETHGINAAMELPALVDIAMQAGDLVPAHLVLHERRSIVDGKTSRYVVPGLDLDITPRQLLAITQGQPGAAAVGAGAPVAVGGNDAPAATGAGPGQPASGHDAAWWQETADACTTVEEVRAHWQQAIADGELYDGVKAILTARVNAIQAQHGQDVEDDAPDYYVDESESAEDPDAPTYTGGDDPRDVDDAWSALVTAGGHAHLKLEDLRAAFEGEYGHPVEEATVAELTALTATIRGTTAATAGAGA